MSNLAQLASKLQAKDAERSVLNDDIKACEALKSQGKFGKLLITVQESALGGKECSLSFRIVEDASQAIETLDDKKPDEECEFALVEREANLQITVKWKDSSEMGELEPTTYNIHTKVIPSNQTIITDVEPAEGSGSLTKIRVKASFETLDSIIGQKKLSLSEVEEQLQALKLEMKGGGSSGQSKAKGNASKQTTANSATKKKKATFQDDNDTKLSAFQSSINMAQQIGITAIGGAFHFRAMIMFGVSVFAIGMYGDRLSV